MANYLAKLHELEKFLLTVVENNDNDDASIEIMKNRLDEDLKSSTDLTYSLDCEAIFRSTLANLLSSSQLQLQDIENSLPIKLIKFVLLFSRKHHSIGVKTAFVMIDDLLEDQTIEYVKKVWTVLESWSSLLTDPTLFAKGKLPLLKICNNLLRRLLKSCETEFYGKILFFLAIVLPITDKSALNSSGKINTGNVTFYEDKAKFDESFQSPSTGNQISTVIDAVAGEDGEEVERQKSAPLISFDIYESFWKLQNYFSSDKKDFDDTTFWTEFISQARKVIELFESVQESNSDASNFNSDSSNHKDNSNIVDKSLEQDKLQDDEDMKTSDNNSTQSNSSTNGSSYNGCKFLTSAQLFALQLKNPLLRQQVALQLLFFVHYMKVKALPVVEGEKKNEYLKDILFVQNKAYKLVESARTGHSRDLLKAAQRLLEREEHWIHWKLAGCPEFNKSLSDEDFVGKKRKLNEVIKTETSSTGVQHQQKKPAFLSKSREKNLIATSKKFVFDCSDGNIKNVAKHLAASMPNFEEKIQEYIDADDPNNGIEDSYHPKHDHLFCWRVRRLLAEKDISVFRVMHDGDLGKGLRKYKGLPEPEPLPVVATEQFDTEDDLKKIEEQEIHENKEDTNEMEIVQEHESTTNTYNPRESRKTKQDEVESSGGATTDQVKSEPHVEQEEGEELEHDISVWSL